MTNRYRLEPVRSRRIVAALLFALPVIALAGLGGCEKSASPQAQRPSNAGGGTAAEYTPRQAVSLANLKLDRKVQFPEDRMPSSQEVADAVGAFATAIAAGDDRKFATMLAPRDKALLDVIVGSGRWSEQAAHIKTVRICALSETDKGFQCGIGVQDSIGAYLLGWEAAPGGEGFLFSAIAIEPKFAEDVKQLDGASLALAKLPEAKSVSTAKIAIDDKKPSEEPPPQEPNPDSGGGSPLRRDRF